LSRHRAHEFRRLKQNVPADIDIGMDNTSSHKTKSIRDWAANRPRLAPTLHAYVRVLDQSARALLRTLSEPQIKRGTHRATKALEAAIQAHIDTRNADPKPFRWTKPADEILASITRFCRRTPPRSGAICIGTSESERSRPRTWWNRHYMECVAAMSAKAVIGKDIDKQVHTFLDRVLGGEWPYLWMGDLPGAARGRWSGFRPGGVKLVISDTYGG
jgi:hypothetical protein